MSRLEAAAEAIMHARSQEEAFRHYCAFVAHHGYDKAVFSLMTDHPSIGETALHGMLTVYPEDWMKYYRERDCHEVDPVFQLIISRPGAFFWSHAIEKLSLMPRFQGKADASWARLMKEAAEAGLHDGISVSIVNASGEIAGFGISRPQAEDDHNINALADIFLLSSMFYDSYLGSYRSGQAPHLTQREKDVLSWSAAGKTDWEIAEITGISTATVRFHWNNIFKKMGSNNKMAATVTAVRRKLIIPDTLRSINQKQG
ncbi:LuxR family transcriptional regulator [Martelella sp. HB161492]|uniref:helix-turn-helix transcriptional regulator n=1 Tax=Martelella sp. HB161492 TaxID=2720726 RepID=UPI00159237CC|nr:LuxR family transcriptional regulator [Martelella sp. HB161492]